MRTTLLWSIPRLASSLAGLTAMFIVELAGLARLLAFRLVATVSELPEAVWAGWLVKETLPLPLSDRTEIGLIFQL